PSMAEDLQVDRATLSAPYSLFVFFYTWLSLLAGRLTDKLGPRAVISFGAVALGAGYMALSTATVWWEPYVYLGCIAAVGASVAFVPCNATVIKWFVRRRGFALGLASSGTSAAAVFGPAISVWLIGVHGWRDALLILGFCVAALTLLAAQAMVRDPESRGLHPDGDQPTDHEAVGRGDERPRSDEGPPWTLSAAARTRAFWFLVAALFCSWLVVFFPMLHVIAYGLDRGLSGPQAASLLSGIGVGGLLGRLLAGLATDRFGRVPGLIGSLVLQIVAFLAFAHADTYTWLISSSLLFGFGYSGVSVLFPALVGDLFGRTNVGAIAGLVFAIGGSAAAAGPYLAGAFYDATGRYELAFVVAAVLNSFAALWISFLDRPAREGVPQDYRHP
ncbi:MAG: MFS transporter, partial [Chromatiales bacterium]|nr:MFS transporter [Chromatiales bacterium]